MPEVRAARTLGLYLARPREVGTDYIIELARQRGQRVALPAWRPQHAAYGMTLWEAGAPLIPGPHGIPEPAQPVWISLSEIETLIVTCLAFDTQGWRLGHGGGHFDRLLAAHPGRKLCLAFEGQKLVAVPCEAHDVPVHVVLTERAIYRAPGGLAYADPEAWKNQ